MAKLDWRPVRGRGAGANDLGDGETPVLLGERNAVATLTPAHPMDQEPARKLLRQLLQWYFYERDRQSANRMEMAIDNDMYDNLQWDEQDAATLEDRKQVPLVFNEVAPMCDWIIGTERRNRVDWKVLPRTEDDVQMASTKTDVLKYVSDVNKVPFARSRAFSDAIKGASAGSMMVCATTRPRRASTRSTRTGATSCTIRRPKSSTVATGATCSAGAGWTRTLR